MTTTGHSETDGGTRSAGDNTSNTTNTRSSSSSTPPRTASPAAPPSSGQHSSTNTTTKPDRITEFLTRKHAELQTLLARYPIIPRLVAIGIAYCAVCIICIASLIVLFVGSFVLTGHDRVVARLRWLYELAQARRDEGLAGRGLSLVWWLIRLAADLVTAMVAATGATGTTPSGPEHDAAGAKTQQQQQNRPSSGYSADREYRRRSTYGSSTSTFQESTAGTSNRRGRPQSAYASYQ
ncbi:hypothetical protein BDF22DRAFT_416760 [Syncephalis plumigaleata]|nr:hypothetical protein BDF22DRAFT_416760 [Syncephalis plumigaleata]